MYIQYSYSYSKLLVDLLGLDIHNYEEVILLILIKHFSRYKEKCRDYTKFNF